jgi:carbamate kinase
VSTRPLAVVALGGHALLPLGAEPSVEGQFAAAGAACRHLVDMLARGWDVVLTHGNGPQVGHILLRSELAAGKAYPVTLAAAVAESEGEVGYVLQQSLHNALAEAGLARAVVTVLTQVVVDGADPAFAHPTKPIGPAYDEEQAERLRAAGMALAPAPGHGWRRVVASPEPLEVVEAATVRALVRDDTVVIAAGGGGIPVVREDGRLRGVDAVIDKDLASALLAHALDADLLALLTDVRHACLRFGAPDERALGTLTVDEAARYAGEGHFPPGSMGPKVEAAMRFVRATGNPALITTPEALMGALEGTDGTRITP